MAENIYKVMLKYSNGRNVLISIPGAETRDGFIYVPESIEVEGKLFLLNKKGHTDEWFAYTESHEKPKPLATVIPFKPHLH